MAVSFALGQMTLQKPSWDPRTFEELYDDALSVVEAADRLGYHSFWLAEHHGAEDGYIPSTLPFLAAAAARTTRIGLGTGVMLAPFHDPLRIAEDAAVLDLLSHGRLRLGLGLGWSSEEYRMFAAPKAGRGKRLEEFVHALRRAWSPGRFDLQGEHLHYEDVSVTPKPSRQIPIFLGGASEPAIHRAARIADGYFPPSTSGGPEALLGSVRTVLAYRMAAGNQDPFSFGCFLAVGIGSDADEAWKKIRRGILHTRGSYLRWAQERRDLEGCDDDAAAWESSVREGAVVGSPHEVAEQLRPLVTGLAKMDLAEAFISLILVPVGMQREDALEQVERFATEVRPILDVD